MRYAIKGLESAQSRPQSLRSFWPAAGIESSGSNHFEITKEITEFCPSGLTQSSSLAHARNGCSQSLSIPAAGQKDRRLWGREWNRPGRAWNGTGELLHERFFGTVPHLPVPRLPLGSTLKFWALVPHYILDRLVYTSKLGVPCLKIVSTVPKI